MESELSQKITEETPKTTEESKPKITAVTKTEKVKDPRRVEDGKRFPQISKEAKARKPRERLEAENPGVDYKYIIGAAEVVAAAISLYYSARRNQQEEKT